MSTITRGTRIAVIDDERRQAETAAGIAEEAGLHPVVISEGDGTFVMPHQLLDSLRLANCTAAICDHRLSQTQFAQFDGAEFMSALFKERIPAVLLSTFAAIDGDTSIRLHRAEIPYIIRRNDLAPEEIVRGLELCIAEFAGDPTPERTPRRTLVRVADIAIDGSAVVVDAIVHTWSPDIAVRFPLEVVEDPEIQRILSDRRGVGLRLFAEVNVGCEKADELFFRSFEFAPEPNIDRLRST